ncbi:MAG: fumarylacetoacetate hydrolase family protein [Bacteroidia bacterium]|nr:fumarylacetoacetate hydrolase family protein [Bacteroidia bacterium]MDW8134228.1 fumarylacetoacetate hydrolase family protein [Bacteroidia bacterium]
MKIVCVARNYSLHAVEMGASLPERPIFFLKPATAWAAAGEIPYPSFSQNLEYEAELVFRIAKGGWNLSAEDVLDAVDAITVGIDFTARDLQAFLKSKGLPWEMAKAFDKAAWWGAWLPIPPDWENIPFKLLRHTEILQEGRGKEMIFPLSRLLSEASQYFSLEPGDVLFTGTPKGVGPVQRGDTLRAFFGETCVGEVWIT